MCGDLERREGQRSGMEVRLRSADGYALAWLCLPLTAVLHWSIVSASYTPRIEQKCVQRSMWPSMLIVTGNSISQKSL